MLNNQFGRKSSYYFLKLLFIVMVSFSMILFAGCEEAKVVYPVEVVTSEKTDENSTNEGENPEESIESEEEEKEEAENESTEEEFNLLDIDEPDSEEDENGQVVTFDGKPVIDLVFFMGQSNMSGAGGDASLSPVVKEGEGYEFRSVSDPSKLYPIIEPFGKNESFIGGICDLPGAKKGSMASCFAIEYYRQTGVPIVGVSASQGASTTEIWLSSGFQVDMENRYNNAVNWLEENGYYIRNKYAIWFQGESDAANHVKPEVYMTNMDNIIRPMFIAGLTKVFIVTPGRTLSIKKYFEDIIHEQLKMCKESGYYALGTNLLSDVSASYMVDEWHYNQKVLNLIGIETAKSVAYYTKHQEERIDYNYEDDVTFIPDGFDYSEDEVVEPLDLSNIQALLDEYWDEYLSDSYGE